MKKLTLILTSLSLLLTPFLFTQAQEVDLFWQGSGYTPPFYQGGTPWSKQTLVTLMAVPSGVGNPKTLAYRWIRNGTVLGSYSGTGKNTLTFLDSVLSQPQDIRVEILAYDSYEQPILATRSVTISPSNQSIVIYENNPLYGFMFHKEIVGDYRLEKPEVTLVVFPLFFSGKNRQNQSLTYNWQTSSGTQTGNSATYRAPQGKSGDSRIQVKLTSQTSILQAAEKSFLVKFNNENNN